MTELNKPEQTDNKKNVLSFGEHLYVERKKQNLSVADVAKAIHLPEQVIDAIDRSDVEQLPQPAFVQGYLRAYAKYLGISEAMVLDEYAQAVPHQQESDLQPRSTLPDEASSDSPFVKMITITLLLVMVVAALYASFDYYKKAFEDDEVELDDQTSLSLPEVVENDQSQDEYGSQSELDKQVETDPVEIKKEVVEKNDVAIVEPPSDIVVKEEQDQVVQEETVDQKLKNQLAVTGDDFLVMSTMQVSWVEVDDANGENLYYNLLPQDQSLNLQGTAPFKIFLGNAPEVSLEMNGLDVNIKNRIRSNNVAHFKVSVDQQQIVFH